MRRIASPVGTETISPPGSILAAPNPRTPGRASANAWPMHTEAIDYAYDGQSLRGYLAVDEARVGCVPGVLVVHHAGGLGDEIREKTRRIASLGYCAFALDMFGKGEPVTDGLRRIGEIVADLKRWRGLATAGLDVLAARPECDRSRVGAIGYCFGGTTVYELARSGADLKGVVGFHSGLSPSSGEARNIRGKVHQKLIGADDPLVPPEARCLAFEREMRDAKVDWQNERVRQYGPQLHEPGRRGDEPSRVLLPTANRRALLGRDARIFRRDLRRR